MHICIYIHKFLPAQQTARFRDSAGGGGGGRGAYVDIR